MEEMESRLSYDVHTTGAVDRNDKPEIEGELDLISDLEKDSTKPSQDTQTTLVYKFDPECSDPPELKEISQ